MTQAMRFDVSALDHASQVFEKVADAADRLEKKLKDLDKTKVEIKPRLDTTAINSDIVALRKQLRDIGKGLPKVKIQVDLDGIAAAQHKVDQLRNKLTSLTDASASVDINTGTSEAKLDGLRMKLLHLKSLSPLKLKVELEDDATAGLAAIEAAATALAASRPTIEVDVDSAAAFAQIAALTAALGALAGAGPTIDINLNEPTFLGQLARIRQELNTLAGGRIEIDADTDQAMRELAALRVRLSELARQEQTVVVQADTELARHQIRLLEERLADVARRSTTARVRVELDRSWADAVIRIAALGRALAALKIPIGIAAAAPTIAALGGAAVSAAGSVAILPGAMLAAGAAAAALKVGLSGVGEALKNLDDAKKFGEALKELAPSAQEFAKSVRDIAPAWRDVRLDVQQKLFAGLNAEMQKLSAAYLPTLKAGLGGIATEFNLLERDFSSFAVSSRTIENVDAIFRNTTSAMQAARPAAQNLAGAFLDIGVVGSQLLPELAGGLTAATARFRTFIDQARRSGELTVWIQDGISTLRQLGSIAGNVGGTLGAVFSAQRAAGADLLSTLDQLTAGMERWAKSAEGQRQLTAVFAEIRRTIDSSMPGLQALAAAAAQAVEAFANTGALTAAGQAFSQMAAAVAPLIPQLGELAGGVVNNLANALSAVAAVLGPIVSGLSSLLGALGPIPAAVVAMVVAFRALGPVNALITGLGASIAGLATRMGTSAGVASGIATTFSRLGTAVPILGAAVVAVAAAWDALTVSTSEAARALEAGGVAAQQAAAGLAAQTIAVDIAKERFGVFGDVLDYFTTTTDEARVAMLPLQQAQLDAATAANVHARAVQQFGQSSPQARAAAEALATATGRVQSEQERAADAARSHADQIRDLTGAMQSQLGAALAYEEAVRRSAEAHKAAGEALKENGAKSDEYQKSVLNLTRAQEQQAQAAQRQVEAAARATGATNAAELGLKAYNVELLKLNDGTTQGRDAFVKLASNLDTTSLGMLSATAAATGLKMEILTLPDGRTVTVVAAAETSQLEQVKVDLNALAAAKYVGTVTINGDPAPFRDGVMQAVTFANGMRGVVTIDGNGAPIRALVGHTKHTIDAATGTMTIDGNPAPGEANLTGFKLKVDAATGTMTIEGNPAPAQAAITPLEQPTQSEHTINPNAAAAEAARGGLEMPTHSEHTINPQTGAVDGAKTNAQAPTASDHTINPQTGAVDGAKTSAQAPTSSTHTFTVDAGPVNIAKSAAQTATASIHTINVDAGPVQRAKADAQVATSSMHTINADDSAVVTAKARAQQQSTSTHKIGVDDGAVTRAKANAQRATSSTHTIHVRVVGAPIPRAAGAYATPRAEGAYAAAYARGGMRKMSAARAEIVPPRQPRIIGDRMQGDEAFIPINRSARSRAILNTAANRMGYDVVPRMTDRKVTGASDAALSTICTARSQRPGSSPNLGGLTKQLGQLVGELRGRTGQQVTITNEFAIANASQAADAVSRAHRVSAALGIFSGAS